MAPDDAGRAPPRPQRAHARVQPQLQVQLDAFVRSPGADREYVFRTRDVSEGGLFLYTRVGHLYPFSLGGDVTIELHEGATIITLRGVVARIVQPGSPEAREYPVGFGIQLLPLSPTERAPLLALLDRMSDRPDSTG